MNVRNDDRSRCSFEVAPTLCQLMGDSADRDPPNGELTASLSEVKAYLSAMIGVM